jgi:hypothetical protein
MWRRWLKTKWRLRLSTLMLLIIIFGMAVALVLQQQREARLRSTLRSALRSASNANDEAIQVALNDPFDAKLIKAAPTGGTLGIVTVDPPIDAKLISGPTLGLLLQAIKRATRNGVLWDGIPIFVDQIGLQEVGRTMNSPVTVSSNAVPIRKALKDALDQLKLCYVVKDGWMLITSKESIP